VADVGLEPPHYLGIELALDPRPHAARLGEGDGTPIARFRRNAFGFSDNLPLSNFKLHRNSPRNPTIRVAMELRIQLPRGEAAGLLV
jgi:hypothetical protein